APGGRARPQPGDRPPGRRHRGGRAHPGDQPPPGRPLPAQAAPVRPPVRSPVRPPVRPKVTRRRAFCLCRSATRRRSDGGAKKGRPMSTLRHVDPRTMFPDLIEWFEEPFMTLRPYLAQPIKVEEFVADEHYMIRAELAGIDP